MPEHAPDINERDRRASGVAHDCAWWDADVLREHLDSNYANPTWNRTDNPQTAA